MTRTFTLPWSNPDLDIHPAPAEGWHRVAVVGLWTDAKRLRKDWPDAAVCGPLRTLRGIDLLVRGLLANPQIRVLVVVGRDLTPGEGVRKALESAWKGGSATDKVSFAVDIYENFEWLRHEVDLLDNCDAADLLIEECGTEDRPGGAIILPPPPPPKNPELPAGLPGQRITGKTLADVWPKVLHEVLRFGDTVGNTRELLNLVSVIEDPKGSLNEVHGACVQALAHQFGTKEGVSAYASLSGDAQVEHVRALGKHPILGISQADLDDYYKSFMGPTPPEGVPYTYGSRLHGPPVLPTVRACDRERMTRVLHRRPNQLAAVRKLLTSSPGTRAAYLTPWRPDEDCGKESGRPCFVGALFRAVPASAPRYEINESRDVDGMFGVSEVGSPIMEVQAGATREEAQREVDRLNSRLHLTVTFRSHNMHRAYPLNLAAVCRWLCEEAAGLGMEVGTVTCVSMSAHVYDHALEAAGKVVAEHVKPGTWSQDPRSAWRVWIGKREQPQPKGLWPTLYAWKRSGDPWRSYFQRIRERIETETGRRLELRDTWATLDDAAQPDDELVCLDPTPEQMERWAFWAFDLGGGGHIPMPSTPTYCAEATDPEGSRVLALFEAPTKERLVKDIQASGLVTSVEHALWLGAEIGGL